MSSNNRKTNMVIDFSFSADPERPMTPRWMFGGKIALEAGFAGLKTVSGMIINATIFKSVLNIESTRKTGPISPHHLSVWAQIR